MMNIIGNRITGVNVSRTVHIVKYFPITHQKLKPTRMQLLLGLKFFVFNWRPYQTDVTE